MEYLAHIYIQFVIFSCAAMALNLFTGRSGYVSLAHAGLFGFGAYTHALLIINFDWPPALTWLLVFGLAGLFCFFVSAIIFRAKDDYFVIMTLALQMMIYFTFLNLTALTKGPLGISGIPALPLSNAPALQVILATIIGVAFYMLLAKLEKSQLLILMRGIKDDELVITSFGYNVARTKALTFGISSGITAALGAIYAQFIGYIDPFLFDLNFSIFILSIVILAGFSSHALVILAAALLVLVPEALRFTGLGSSYEANIREMFYGLAICISVVFTSYKHRSRQFASS